MKMIRILLLAILLGIAYGQMFHEQLDRGDLRYYFGVDNANQVPKYTFTEKPSITPIKRKGHAGGVLSEERNFTLSAFGELFMFELRVNRKILTPDCVIQYFNKSGAYWSTMCHDVFRPCNYLGLMVPGKDYWAAISYCNHIGTMRWPLPIVLIGKGQNVDLWLSNNAEYYTSASFFKGRDSYPTAYGVFTTQDHDFTIMPLKPHHIDLLHSLNKTSSLDHTYLVSKLTRSAHAATQEDETTSQQQIEKNSTKLHIEVVVDQSAVEFHRQDSQQFGLDLLAFITTNMNIVYSLFQDETLTYKISPVISRITILETEQTGLNITEDAEETMNSFTRWYSHTSPTYRPDLALLLTRLDMAKKAKMMKFDLNGFAYQEGVCSPSYDHHCILAEDTGLGTAFTIAHEIGHTLTIPHDNQFPECNGTGNIMQSFSAFGNSSFHWSSCSNRVMMKFLDSPKSKCLKDHSVLRGNMTFLPGMLYDEEDQCKLSFGEGYTPCKVLADRCEKQACCVEGQAKGIMSGIALMDGTECGNGTRMWCMKGRCELMGPDGPPPLDGQWSDWGMWSACSRTAGGGVRTRTRICNKPKPRYYGKLCDGEKMDVRLCNIQPFGASDTQYKTQQQALKKAAPGSYDCHMIQTENNQTTQPAYTDGTNCKNRHRGQISKCFQGKCQVFGCDGYMNSPARFDDCGVCNGDGTACQPITEMYDVRSSYKQGKSSSFKIPVDSTGIYIHNSHTDIVKIESSLLFPRSYHDRYDIVDKRHIFKNDEEIFILGPLNETAEFKVEMTVEHVNLTYDLKVNFTYHVPPRSPQAYRYQWISTYSACSVTCGTGYKVLTHVCMDNDTQPVDDSFCDIKQYPEDRRMNCTGDPCLIRWYHTNWGQCSQSCGGGTQQRQVSCVAPNGDELIPQRLSDCNPLLKPAVSRMCNEQDCPPFWLPSHWSNCSSTCGIGVQYRSLKCVKWTNQSQEVHKSQCLENKPVTLSACCQKYCKSLMAEENAVSCTQQMTYCYYLRDMHCLSIVIMRNCPQTCGTCGCEDRADAKGFCENKKYCHKYPRWAKLFCPRSCGYCMQRGSGLCDST